MHEPAAEPLLRIAPAEIHGRYLVRPPATPGPAPWLIGFHGQGQTADQFLARLDRLPRRPAWLLASVQGLNRHYASREQRIAATWMTSQDRELAIADNVRWVEAVLDRLEAEFGAPHAIVYAGFSQGVAMAHRAAMLGRRPCAGVIACCGDVPPELLAAPPRAWPRVLAAAGAADAWYPPARLHDEVGRMRAQGADAQALVLEGGHEWTDAFAAAVGRWLDDPGRGSS